MQCEITHIFDSQEFTSIHWLKSTIFYKLKEKFVRNWRYEIYDSSKGINYRIYKHDLSLENYLLDLPPKLARAYCKFRTRNIKIPIESGRWSNIPREERLCKLCILNEIGDEFHYLFNCTDQVILHSRRKYMSRYYFERPSTFKFNTLFNFVTNRELVYLAKFITDVNQRINSQY